MSAPSRVSGSPRDAVRPRDVVKARKAAGRRFASSDGAPVEVLESGPSIAARVATLASRLTIRPILSVGSNAPTLPWPWGLIDLAAKALLPVSATVRDTVQLPNASAQLVRAPGVLPADGTRRIVVYFHGGAFLTCGANSHGRVVEAISKFADSPVLVVNYRLLPKHSVGMALDDCYDAYQWVKLHGYPADQIVLAGDSAGGYLALALAQRLQQEGEEPAALVAISPLLQLSKECKQAHPNIKTDAMFAANVFDALGELVASAAEKNIVDGKPEDIYEPLDHITPGLPRTLIHVSGSEVLLHDAQLAASRLATAGVPVEVRVWPGQVHDFQLAGSLVPEAERSLRQIGEYIREATG
jgi:acetyl esterase/lipase